MSSPCDTCGGYGEHYAPDVSKPVLITCYDCDGTGYEFTQQEMEDYLKLKKILE
jgi:DnaJ-class molecular chaperone